MTLHEFGTNATPAPARRTRLNRQQPWKNHAQSWHVLVQ